ncbi:MAG TPA: 50S ribosomal protein L17 [Armatimonadota bacterium]|nr:50S ribosomal protein L17 [Armatimonadota bacterium]
MRHRRAYRKLNMPTDQRLAMLRNLTKSLIVHGRIETTQTRAKEARRLAERLITLAKTDSVHNRREAGRVLGTERKLTPAERKAGIEKVDPIRKLFETIGPEMKDKPGGYTRLTSIGYRRGDGVEMAVLELVPD